MKILQICPKPPSPPVDGGCLASFQLSQNLLSIGAELKVLCISTDKHPFLKDEIDPDYAERTDIEHIYINTSFNPLNLFLGSIRKEAGVQMLRFYRRDFKDRLLEILESETYDAIILDGLMTAFYLEDIRKQSNAEIIYRSHNLEHYIFKQQAKTESSKLKAYYISKQAGKLQKFEEKIWRQSDVIWSISSFDSVVIKNTIGQEEKVKNIPFSMDKERDTKKPKSNTLFHLGAMDWGPNVEGLEWFLAQVWPAVISAYPQSEFHLGGKSIGKSGLKAINGVTIHQEVKDANEFYNQYEIMIVPVLSGSGIRIKLIQALAMGKVIVCTKRGVMGIPAIHAEHMMISDSAEEMQEHIKMLLGNEELRDKLSRNARRLFEDHYRFNKVSSQIQDSLKSEIKV